MSRGFTLIEGILVIVVLGILAGLYISFSGNLSDASLDAASHKVQNDIRYAHQLATSTGVNHGAAFTAGGSYEIYSGSPGTPATDPVSRGGLVEDLSKYQGVSIGNSYQVEFNSLGEPVVGGDGHVRLNAVSGEYKDVYVVDKTGAVVIDAAGYASGCGLLYD